MRIATPTRLWVAAMLVASGASLILGCNRADKPANLTPEAAPQVAT
jgi:hypothetical protein